MRRCRRFLSLSGKHKHWLVHWSLYKGSTYSKFLRDTPSSWNAWRFANEDSFTSSFIPFILCTIIKKKHFMNKSRPGRVHLGSFHHGFNRTGGESRGELISMPILTRVSTFRIQNVSILVSQVADLEHEDAVGTSRSRQYSEFWIDDALMFTEAQESHLHLRAPWNPTPKRQSPCCWVGHQASSFKSQWGLAHFFIHSLSISCKVSLPFSPKNFKKRFLPSLPSYNFFHTRKSPLDDNFRCPRWLSNATLPDTTNDCFVWTGVVAKKRCDHRFHSEEQVLLAA